MSIDLGEQDQGFLLQLIRDGEATLVLGAGATFGSINSERRPVLLGNQLAKRIAEAAGQNYSGETLTEVLGGISDLLSQVKIQKIYESEYRGVIPSNELSDLFKYTWKRVYTWNIDDSIQNVTERSAQRRRYYNGIADRVADYESKEFVHPHRHLRQSPVERPQPRVPRQPHRRQQMGVDVADAEAVEGFAVDEGLDLCVRGDFGAGQVAQGGEDAAPVAQIAHGDLADDERVAQHLAGLQARRKVLVPSAQVGDPDGRIDEDHGGVGLSPTRRSFQVGLAAAEAVERPEDRHAWGRKINLELLKLEGDVFKAGFVKVFLLFFDSCGICLECAASRTACKEPKLSRPTPDALAMDVYSTVRKLGYPINVLSDYKQEMNRYAFLLIE